MEGAIFLPVIIVGAVVLVVVLVANNQAKERRAQKLTAWAEHRGWRFDRGRPDLVDFFPGTPFENGSRRRVQHVLSGVHRGLRTMLFEHLHDTTSGNSRTTHTHRIVAVETPTTTPVLEVKEQHFGHRLLNLIGIHDLELGDQEFDDTFRVTTTADDFARAVLSADVRAWLLRQPVGWRVPFRFAGTYLVTWEGIRLEADHALLAADFLAGLLEQIPAQVWRDGGDGTASSGWPSDFGDGPRVS